MIAAWTAPAAASMFLSNWNWTVSSVPPVALNERISTTPGMMPICRSSGCASADAMVSALAPGSPAHSAIVGRSTDGIAAIGSRT